MLDFCQFAPVLLLAPWAGSARTVTTGAAAVRSRSCGVAVATMLAVLAWAGLAPAWVVIGCSARLGVDERGLGPGAAGADRVAGRAARRPEAVALNSMTFNLARAIGPASAAAVIATLGIPWAFALNSVLVSRARRRR